MKPSIRTATGLALAAVFLNCAPKPKFEPAKSNLLEKLQAKKQKLGKDGVLAEVAMGESRNLQTAINKVELEARAKLSRALEAKTSSLQKRFQEEVGRDYADHFSQTVKSVSDRVLRGSTLTETPFEQNGEGVYRVYGLMILDAENYAKSLASELEADKAMRDRWRASRAYKELNEEIEAFQKWKQGERPPETAQGL